MAGILRIVLGWGLKSPASLLLSSHCNMGKKTMWPRVGLQSVPEQSLEQVGSAEPSASCLPGAPIRRPSHSHVVLHLRGDRHAGKPLLPLGPFCWVVPNLWHDGTWPGGIERQDRDFAARHLSC